MTEKLIDGKALAQKLREEMGQEVARLQQQGVQPGLAVVLVGEDPASQVYVSMKEKACHKVGLYSEQYRLAASTSQQELLDLIDQLNANAAIHGILVQLPLPDHIQEQAVIEAISPQKDVDGFHPYNVGRLVAGNPTFMPCTPYGVMRMLEHAQVQLQGQDVVIVGRSNIVGKPLALMCLEKHATVTVCHSRTRDLAQRIGQADVLIAAVGRPKMIPGDWIKPGAVVIDVGVNRIAEKTLVGDVDFDSALPKASLITPVPGGVGPMTITMLLHNTIQSAGNSLQQG